MNPPTPASILLNPKTDEMNKRGNDIDPILIG